MSDASGMYDVSGTMWQVYAFFHLWREKHLAAVRLAGLQPDLPHGVHERLDAPLEGPHRRRMDRDPIRTRQGRPSSRT
jgi:hypothetical protein